MTGGPTIILPVSRSADAIKPFLFLFRSFIIPTEGAKILGSAGGDLQSQSRHLLFFIMVLSRQHHTRYKGYRLQQLLLRYPQNLRYEISYCRAHARSTPPSKRADLLLARIGSTDVGNELLELQFAHRR
jgi:hypothetical protein